MHILIIEDETPAFARLKAQLKQVLPEAEIVAHHRSVRNAIDFLNSNPTIDLAFFDIQLEDGSSFSILENCSVSFPIIFTTAYDKYAIQAFDHHSIGYLLKPISSDALKKSINKFKQQTSETVQTETLLNALKNMQSRRYKERFTVKIGDRIRIFETQDISLFYSRSKGSYLFSNQGKHHLLDQSLDTIESLVDPEKFFRVNRKHIIHIDAIDEMIQYTNSRLKIKTTHAFDEDVIVAREKVKSFRQWVENEGTIVE